MLLEAGLFFIQGLENLLQKHCAVQLTGTLHTVDISEYALLYV
jgi:hypothetical protein